MAPLRKYPVTLKFNPQTLQDLNLDTTLRAKPKAKPKHKTVAQLKDTLKIDTAVESDAKKNGGIASGRSPGVSSPNVGSPSVDVKLLSKSGLGAGTTGVSPMVLDRSGRKCKEWVKISKPIRSFSGYTMNVVLWNDAEKAKEFKNKTEAEAKEALLKAKRLNDSADMDMTNSTTVEREATDELPNSETKDLKVEEGKDATETPQPSELDKELEALATDQSTEENPSATPLSEVAAENNDDPADAPPVRAPLAVIETNTAASTISPAPRHTVGDDA
ncbi:hypothetical protein BABINDRAFT_141411 [Babjeviella inositovora NRRL Y-12698]|uniref:Uncharacterized protein n=1 Tax=Babjeviella inositovora NRRL Y-12698 TaxID=984486 RepID=A0A1E3QNS6_9ASCO|nr:uncharacterized protein BABINDRAFT_141411 [Babjeviella inositovora NRRL Y-12698]ODQ79331.1 hypothetical protein BABINDRAFT_141411 [Babjeviella inositovora NRRL Y-12698]